MSGLGKINKPPTAQKAPTDAGPVGSSDGDWLKRGQDAYHDSTTYIDNNFRKSWDDSIRAFNNQHASDSKFNHPSYSKRSNLYRPKIRSIIRKNEAAAAAAFFSNMDVTSIAPTDQTNKVEVASAEVMKELLQYRLTKSIPWYQIVLGGLQDAQTTGVVVAHVHWEYEEAEESVEDKETLLMGQGEQENTEYDSQVEGALPDGVIPVQLAGGSADPEPPPSQNEFEISEAEVIVPEGAKPIKDRPAVDLFPIENLRIDPSANWIDPINSSPYVIHLIPMYVMDVREKMESKTWRNLADATLLAAVNSVSDSTRLARNKNNEDPYSNSGGSLPDYEIVWVQRHIHRRKGIDWEFYLIGDVALLSDPRPLKDTVFHGKRPYVMGNCILETHKPFPTSIPNLGKGLADESNEICNQRIDNVKFVLNKKWFAKRGREVDIGGLVRNVPGGVVMMEDPMTDVREVTWPDVTASAFEEQGRIDNDMNDLLGNFSPAQVMADHGINGPARNMAVLSQASGTLVEYLLMTYVMTFVQNVLRQIVLLEQHYETDQVVLAIAAKKAGLFQKFGIDKVTDELLEQELTLTVNVGMNATDPQLKLSKFLTATKSYAELTKLGVPGMNFKEVSKEIYGLLGYSDGSRFFTSEDPQVIQLQQELQKSHQLLAELNAKLADKSSIHATKIKVAEVVAQNRVETEMIKQDNQNLRTSTVHLRAIAENSKDMAHQVALKNQDKQHELTVLGLEHGRSGFSVPQSTMGDAPKARTA